MAFRTYRVCALGFVLALLAAAPAPALEPGDDQYPNSIMAPEPGSAGHHRGKAEHFKAPRGRAGRLAKRPGRGLYAIRGSAGSVLPTPLPRTPLIPPEGGGTLTTHPLPQEQGVTIVPSAPGLGAIPNLPHSPGETFQDRASRCSFQQGLNNVPGSASNQYMGACVH